MSAGDRPTTVLTIAGSDSSGGAGVQADVKTITALGAHAQTAVTAVTAQTSDAVSALHPVPAKIVTAQIEAAMQGGCDAIKIGMLGSDALIAALMPYLSAFSGPIIFDPVMIASSGDGLMGTASLESYKNLARYCTLITPNHDELAVLVGQETVDGSDVEGKARALANDLNIAVLAKGGHGQGDMITDYLVHGQNVTVCLRKSKIETQNSHGTGCVLSSAIATYMAAGSDLRAAVDSASMFVRAALQEGRHFKGPNGPVMHLNITLDGGISGTRLNQISLGCSDYAASVAFYKTLGLHQIVDDPPRYARFESAGGVTFSIENSAAQPEGAHVVYLESDNLDAQCQELLGQGMIFDQMPRDEDWGWREARLRDPFGNKICLYFAGENRRYPSWRMD